MNRTVSRAAIVVVDTVTALGADHRGVVLVTGSHGGEIAARYAAAAGVRAAIFNDAGVGLEDAGIAGLRTLQALGIAAAAVSHRSARIGDGRDTLASGTIAHANALALSCGVTLGERCTNAAERLALAPLARRVFPPTAQGRHPLLPADRQRPRVIGLDSIGIVRPQDGGAILVIGSHGALHGGDPASALAVDACAAFFSDAGRGKEDAGVSRLPVLARRGIPAGAVDHRSARIGDARSLWSTGVVSCVNDPLRARGTREAMTVQEAIALLRDQAT